MSENNEARWTERAQVARRFASDNMPTDLADKSNLLLVGILKQDTSAGVAVLVRLGIDISALRTRIERSSIEARIARDPTKLAVPAPNVEVVAAEEAAALRHPYIGTEHLLLAMLKAQSSEACRALTLAGIDYEKVRTATLRLLGVEPAELKSK